MDDYEARQPLGSEEGDGASRGTHVVQRAQVEGTLVVLKGYPMHDRRARDALEREVRFVNSVDHPAVIKVTAFAIEERQAYSVAWVEYPFAEGGDLTRAAAPGDDNRLPPWEVQSLMRQAVCGLSALARSGIVHKDIKPANLLRTGDGRLVITDFDIAKGADELTMTGGASGTRGYIAPEVLVAGGGATHKSDMYALGVVLHELRFGRKPVAQEGDVVHAVPDTDDAHLRDLLSQLFACDPAARPSADAALMHGYFRQSFAAGLVAGGELLERDRKVDAVREALAGVRERHEWSSRTESVTLSREHAAQEATAHFAALLANNRRLRQRPYVTFTGEPGVDAGGLTTEMYRLLFDGIVGGPDRDGPAGGAGGDAPPLVMPAADGTALPRGDADKEVCRAIGAAMAKAAYDGRCVTAPLSPVFFSFVCGVAPTMRDLELFDPALARGYQQTLAMSAEEVESMLLDFEGLKEGGEAEAVTGVNRVEYIRLCVQKDLVECRRAQLEAMRDGMLAAFAALSSEVAPLLRLLAPADWQLLLCGDPYVSAEAVLNAADWRDFDADDAGRRTAEWLRAAVGAMTADQLRRLCQFMTGSPRLPQRLVFGAWRAGAAGALPQAHACFNMMDVPCDARDGEELRERLGRALEHADGFEFA